MKATYQGVMMEGTPKEINDLMVLIDARKQPWKPNWTTYSGNNPPWMTVFPAQTGGYGYISTNTGTNYSTFKFLKNGNEVLGFSTEHD